ncbi:hypothetical protein TNCV_1476381 [Trichonephila clavipes]|nr:hypothetical protein TNCV_1476381 [Trichonephila clavipes]
MTTHIKRIWPLDDEPRDTSHDVSLAEEEERGGSLPHGGSVPLFLGHPGNVPHPFIVVDGRVQRATGRRSWDRRAGLGGCDGWTLAAGLLFTRTTQRSQSGKREEKCYISAETFIIL